jgi:transposase
MEGTLFLACVQQILAPELRRGDLVIGDNLSSHKVRGVQAAVAACGAEWLDLPAYSADLNPIKLAFAKLNAFLAATRPPLKPRINSLPPTAQISFAMPNMRQIK